MFANRPVNHLWVELCYEYFAYSNEHEEHIHIYDISNMKMLHTIDIGHQPKGKVLGCCRQQCHWWSVDLWLSLR
jgi:hypothetical protein